LNIGALVRIVNNTEIDQKLIHYLKKKLKYKEQVVLSYSLRFFVTYFLYKFIEIFQKEEKTFSN
jgi:hypothetical protein